MAFESDALDSAFSESAYEAAKSGRSHAREADVPMADGGLHSISATLVPLSDELVVMHARDVTREQTVEKRLRVSEARYRAVVESIPDVIFRMDADARIIDAHFPKYFRQPLWDPADLPGRTVGDFYGSKAEEAQARYNREAIRTGEMQVFEFRLPVVDGAVHLESRVVRVGSNEVIVTTRDISRRVERENKQMLKEQKELNRLSREIHDGLAQILVGANLRLENAARNLAVADSEQCDALEEVAELIRQAIGQARDLSRGVNPVPPGTALFEAMELAAHHSEQRLGVQCKVVRKGSDEHVGPLATTHLYRIAQEAITNAVRHGIAKQVSIDLNVGPEFLTLTVEDDGTGLSLREDSQFEGIGLLNMTARAHSMGGNIELENRAAGKGAVLKCVCGITSLID